MYNTVEITTDSINLYIHSKTKPRLAARIGIIAVCGLALTLCTILLIFLIKEKAGGAVLAVLVMTSAMYFLFGRILLWNLFGEETLIVNTKSISYFFDYGFFKTKIKTCPHNKLATLFIIQREVDHVNFGSLQFISYDELDVPFVVYETSIYLQEERIREIQEKIQDLYHEMFYEENGFPPFSLS